MENSPKDIKLWESNSHGFCNIYFGRKWSWKTTQAVIDAYEAHKDWQIIISNTWLNFPHIRFTDTKNLVPILKEIAQYCNMHKIPIEAPTVMLKDYGIDRKKWKVNKYFLLFDEIGKHLNRRNWQANFKEEFMRDMLTEPRKYNLTIVGITQSWKRVDNEFLEACEDWFLFSKTGWKWFERVYTTHLWVHNGEFNFEKPIIIWKNKRWVYWDKNLTFYRTLFYSGEIIGDGLFQGFIPHMFKVGDIYSGLEIVNRKMDSRFISLPIQKALENEQSEAERIEGDEGGDPLYLWSYNLLSWNKKIKLPTWSQKI